MSVSLLLSSFFLSFFFSGGNDNWIGFIDFDDTGEMSRFLNVKCPGDDELCNW